MTGGVHPRGAIPRNVVRRGWQTAIGVQRCGNMQRTFFFVARESGFVPFRYGTGTVRARGERPRVRAWREDDGGINEGERE